MKDKFNRYCAEVMGYKVRQKPNYIIVRPYADRSGTWLMYNPYDDLNQSAKVVDKLMMKRSPRVETMVNQPNNIERLVYTLLDSFTKKAFRNFISSTIPEDKADER